MRYYVYYRRPKENYSRENIWSYIDPLKVKQRIDRITRKLEQAQHPQEPFPLTGESKDSPVQGEGRQEKGETEISQD